MNAETLNAKFARIGARFQLGEMNGIGRSRDQSLTLDIGTDSEGEFFDVRLRPSAYVELDVVDLQRRDRHLLLQARERDTNHFYLCGHDEQHWFVAAIPEQLGVPRGVAGAMEALKPPEVLEAQRRQGIKGKDRQRRKNAAYVRQGEWFFLPAPRLHVLKEQVLLNEPLSRGEGSKPHWAEYLYRKGGEVVYVCEEHPSGLSFEAYFGLIRASHERRSGIGGGWSATLKLM